MQGKALLWETSEGLKKSSSFFHTTIWETQTSTPSRWFALLTASEGIDPMIEASVRLEAYSPTHPASDFFSWPDETYIRLQVLLIRKRV